MSKKEQKLPNFLGDEFLFSVKHIFLVEADLHMASYEVKKDFSVKVMTDFIYKTSLMIIYGLNKKTFTVVFEVAESDLPYHRREEEFEKHIPEFKRNMMQILELFRKKINLGFYHKINARIR